MTIADLDSDCDELPDGWEWEHFGNLDQGMEEDYHEDGASNLEEYHAGTDSNTILFYTLFDNLRVSGNVATGSVTVLKGEPARMAVLVDNTDLASAAWVSYSASFTANLGSTDGPRTVWLGLKGRADTSEPTWTG